jgi:hypothetical protein
LTEYADFSNVIAFEISEATAKAIKETTDFWVKLENFRDEVDEEANRNSSAFSDFLGSIGIDGDVSLLADEAETNETWFCCPEWLEVGQVKDCETLHKYEYWDGSWRAKYLDSFEEVEISSSSVDLDEFEDKYNDTNKTTGGVGNHAEIYKILTLDGQVPETTLYLLVETTQWQGQIDRANYYTLEELPEALESINRKFEDYEQEILAL